LAASLALPGCFSIDAKHGVQTLGSGAPLNVDVPKALNSGLSFSVVVHDVTASDTVSLAFTDSNQAPVDVVCHELKAGEFVCSPPYTFSGTLEMTVTVDGAISQFAIQFISSAQEDQQIVIDVKIYDAEGSFVAEVSSDASQNSGQLSFTGGATYHFDLSGTLFQGKPAPAGIAYSQSVGGGGLQPVTSAAFDIQFPVAKAAITAQIEADLTDSLGNPLSQQLNLSLSTVCVGVAALDVSGATISIANSSVIGFYDYTVSGVAGGSGSNTVGFDLNGDGVYPDPLSTNAGVVPTVAFTGSSVTVPTQFTIYHRILPPGSGVPSLGASPPYLSDDPQVLAVVTDSCGQTGTITHALTFNQAYYTYGQYSSLPGASTQSGVDGWAQLEVSGGAGNLEPSANAVVTIAHSTAPSPDGIQRVSCAYDPTAKSFSVTALSAYAPPPPSGVTPAHQQGMTLAVSSGVSLGGVLSLSGTLNYVTDGSDDPSKPQAHVYTGTVPVTVKVTSSTASISCSGGATGSATTYAIAWTAGAAPGTSVTLTDALTASSPPKVVLEPYTAAGWCMPPAVSTCP
jgi:hypothetical protein